jgi:hypothetical protein
MNDRTTHFSYVSVDDGVLAVPRAAGIYSEHTVIVLNLK